eukprot:1349252-Amorphochlora_amoeboformis.AAC.2
MLSTIRYCIGDIRHPSAVRDYSKTQMGSGARGNAGVTPKKAHRSSPASFESVDPVSNGSRHGSIISLEIKRKVTTNGFKKGIGADPFQCLIYRHRATGFLEE